MLRWPQPQSLLQGRAVPSLQPSQGQAQAQETVVQVQSEAGTTGK